VDEIFEALQQLVGQGSSLLLVDQFAERVLGMATTAYVLRRGRLAYQGSARELAQSDLFSQYMGTAADSA
jgi:branched-chain amino acid transport system ATP-binding protein